MGYSLGAPKSAHFPSYLHLYTGQNGRFGGSRGVPGGKARGTPLCHRRAYIGARIAPTPCPRDPPWDPPWDPPRTPPRAGGPRGPGPRGAGGARGPPRGGPPGGPPGPPPGPPWGPLRDPHPGTPRDHYVVPPTSDDHHTPLGVARCPREETARSAGGLPLGHRHVAGKDDRDLGAVIRAEGAPVPVGEWLCPSPLGGTGCSTLGAIGRSGRRGPSSTLAVGLRPLGFGSGRDRASLRSKWRTRSEATHDVLGASEAGQGKASRHPRGREPRPASEASWSWRDAPRG